jgi:acetyl esterase/lipase
MSRAALVLAILLVLLAAAAAALIVLPAPSKFLAFLAIAAGERSMFIIGAAVAGTALALLGMHPGARLLGVLAIGLGLGAVVVALVPLAQALRLASEQRVDLDFSRYLRARIDTEGPVRAAKTVSYATVDGRTLGLDVYAPRTRPALPTRAIVVAHGGGWSSGDKGDASLASQWFADHGFTVFDVEYRTAPQPNWRTATGELKCAIGWIKQHAVTPDWNVDPRKITLLGRSAGGHLVLLAAYTPEDARLPASCDAGDTSVESVVAFYAPTDLVWGYAHPARERVYDSSERLRRFVGGTPESTGDLYRILSPTERVTARSPRTLLIHGGRDQFIGRQHVDFLADKLHASGVPYETLIIPYAQHGFDFVFGGLSGQIAEAVILRFLNAAPEPTTTEPATSPTTEPATDSDAGQGRVASDASTGVEPAASRQDGAQRSPHEEK